MPKKSRIKKSVTYRGKQLISLYISKSKSGYVIGIANPKIHGDIHLTLIEEGDMLSWHITDNSEDALEEHPSRSRIDTNVVHKELTQMLSKYTVPYGHNQRARLLKEPSPGISRIVEDFKSGKDAVALEWLLDCSAQELSDPSKWKTVKIRELTKRSGFGLIGQGNDTKIIQPIDDRLMLCFPPGMMVDFLQTLVRYHGLESYFQHLGFERLLVDRLESEQLGVSVPREESR